MGIISITISEDKNRCIKLIGRNVLKDQKSGVVKQWSEESWKIKKKNILQRTELFCKLKKDIGYVRQKWMCRNVILSQ